MKNYLVTYNHCTGGYEFSGYTVLTLKPRREKIKAQVHKYFMTYYYDTKPSYNRLEEYFYFEGDIVVKDIRYREITEAEAAVININL